MQLYNIIDAVLLVFESPRVWRAVLTWPTFSVTSYRLVSRLATQGIAPRTVIDVGANVGQFSVAATQLFPGAHVHAFEPVPTTAAQLRQHVGRLRTVTTHSIALGDRTGTIDIHVNAHSHSSSILPLTAHHREPFPEAREIATVSVPISTLDRVFQNVAMTRPTLLKLDVQGYEAAVLRGGAATLARTDLVVLETSFRPLYEGELVFTELLDMLRNLGFRFDRPVGWLRSPLNGEILQMDALFARA